MAAGVAVGNQSSAKMKPNGNNFQFSILNFQFSIKITTFAHEKGLKQNEHQENHTWSAPGAGAVSAGTAVLLHDMADH
jgi:hypothetical protein